MSLKPGFLAGILFTVLARAAAPALPEIQPFLNRHCIECHDADSRKGGLDLSSLPMKGASLAAGVPPAVEPGVPPGGDNANSRAVGGSGTNGWLSTDRTEAAMFQQWVRVFDRVKAGEMPPGKSPKPPVVEVSAFLATLGTDLSTRHAAQKGTVLRRLNRHEYQNTLNDLLGVEVEVMPLLPEDGRAHGFDTIGEALNVSGIQMQRYMEAAEVALNAAWFADAKPQTRTQHLSFESDRNKAHIGRVWLKRPDGAVVVFTSDGFPSTQVPGFSASAPGLYRVRITGYGFQIAERPVFSVISGTFNRGGDQETRGFYELPYDKPGSVELVLSLRTGDGIKIKPHGLNGPDGHSPVKDGPDRYPGEGLAIQDVEIEGPILQEWPPRGRKILLGDAKLREIPPKAPWLKNRSDYRPAYTVDTANPAADARSALGRFLPLAFRRPITDNDTAPYVALFDREFAENKDYLAALSTAAIAALCSPEFLFLKEPAGRLNDYALAARLSYFLTRSAPDAELLHLAAGRKLTDPPILRAQTERLLVGAGLDRFVADFTDGWLNLREIEFTSPDRLLYPEFDELLLDSILRETRGFIRELFTSNLTLANLIQSDFAMLNSRLARHYGIAGVDGLAIRKVPLPPNSKRGGILTQASILKVSANGTSTSPVIRGVWVLERLLGITPQPPPPGVPGVEPDIRGAQTVREILAKHRSLESCNACHRVIDPPGFALESYDVIGGWRDRFRSMGQGQPVRLKVEGRNVRYRLGPPVDAAGQLPSGQSFKDFTEFQTLLLASRDTVARCVTEKLLTFGAGREMGFSDRAEIDRIVAESKAGGFAARDLLHQVVQSSIFRSK